MVPEMSRPFRPAQGDFSRAVLGVLALGVGYRLLDLHLRPLWFDEAFSWRLSQFPWPELLSRAADDVHPPLYYIFLKLWIYVFGDSTFALRSLSVAWLVATLVGAYLFCCEAALDPEPGRELATMDASLFAPLFLVASPFVFRYSQETRMYVQEIALLTLSSWLLLRALRERHRLGRWWAAYTATATALAYTHHYGLFFVVAQAGLVGQVLWRTAIRAGSRPWANPSARWGVAAVLLIATAYIPWASTLYAQQSRVAHDYWAESLEMSSPLSFTFWYDAWLSCLLHNRSNIGLPFEPHGCPPLLGWALTTAGATVLVLTFIWRRDRISWYVFMSIVLPVDLALLACGAVGRNVILIRHLLPCFTMWLIAAALLLGRLRRRRLRWGLAGLAFLSLGTLTLRYQATLDLRDRPGIRGVSEHIAAGFRQGDLIACPTHQEFFPLLYHAQGRFPVRMIRSPARQMTHYRGGPIFVEQDFVGLADLFAGDTGRVWLVTTSGPWRGVGVPQAWSRCGRWDFDDPLLHPASITLELWERRGPVSDSWPREVFIHTSLPNPQNVVLRAEEDIPVQRPAITRECGIGPE